MDSTTFALIADFFLKGVVASHALWAALCANNGDLDVVVHLRKWRVQDYLEARLVGKLSQGTERPPEDLPKLE